MMFKNNSSRNIRSSYLIIFHGMKVDTPGFEQSVRAASIYINCGRLQSRKWLCSQKTYESIFFLVENIDTKDAGHWTLRI